MLLSSVLCCTALADGCEVDLWAFAADRRSGTSGTPRLAGRGSEGTHCSSIRYVSIARSAASSRRRQSAITSSRIAATSTNSGSALSSRSASHVTTARSGLSIGLEYLNESRGIVCRHRRLRTGLGASGTRSSALVRNLGTPRVRCWRRNSLMCRANAMSRACARYQRRVPWVVRREISPSPRASQR
jgi:hypothetical protein